MYMKNSLIGFIIKLTVFSLLLFLIHYLVLDSYYSGIALYYSLYFIYILLFSITLVIYTALYYLGKIYKDFVGMGFLVGIFVKMIFVFVLFLPFIKRKEYNYLADILNFFIPYFLFLAFETVSVVQIIGKNKSL